MMETLEQKQTKRTPSIEPHAGDTETTPAASEEDDFEEHGPAFELEKKEKSRSPQRELKESPLNPLSSGNDQQNSIDLALENGTAKKEPIKSLETRKEDASQDSDDSSDESSSVECIDNKASIGYAAVAEEKPSASSEPILPKEENQSSIDIKIEESSLPSINVDSSSSPDIKIVEEYSSEDDDNDDYTASWSPAIKQADQTSAQRNERNDEEPSKSDIKSGEKSPLDAVKPNAEALPSPVIETETVEQSSPDTQVIPYNLSSPVYPIDVDSSQDEDCSSPMVKILGKSRTEESLRPPSSALKLPEDIKNEGETTCLDEQMDDEDLSPPEYKIDTDGDGGGEGKVSSPALVMEERQLASPVAASPPSPLYKINDLSPASIPDDGSSQGENDEVILDNPSQKSPTVESKTPMEIIKIESDSEDEEVEVVLVTSSHVPLEPPTDQEDDVVDSKSKVSIEPALKLKINGAHASMGEQETEQQSVIANNNNNNNNNDDNGNEEQHEQEQEVEDRREEPEPVQEHENSRRRSSRSSQSSSVSSASQQLVIDHPESEQSTRQQLLVEQPLQAMKRRRTGSNSTERAVKQQRLKEQSSLLMQRLQAPVTNSSDLDDLMSCYKCNANGFENFQELNAHFAVCSKPSLPAAAESQPDPNKAASPATAAAAETQPDLSRAASPATAATVADPTTLLSISAAASTIKKERFFRCGRCSTVHQCWNFFLHMRDVHQRYICLYCSFVFASVEKLSLHLENKHDIDQLHFGNAEAWRTVQTQEDRKRFLVCCNCQASFGRGSQFDEHDCGELMQPCALCGQKGTHANGCRNGSSSSTTSANNRKKTAARRKRRAEKSKPVTLLEKQVKAKPVEEVPNLMQAEPMMEKQPQPATLLENNIPAPTEDAPREEAMPKLVVPKIMLRVPKEFQKSVDAALSSTDTEEEDNDEQPSAAAECSPLLTVDAVQQQQQDQEGLLPASTLSEDTETATETTSTFLDTNVSVDVEDDDSPTAKLTRVLAEFERTKLDIQRTKAHMMAKKEQQEQQQHQQHQQLQHQLPIGVAAEGQQEQQQQQHEQQQSRWSPTPPASPHNNPINELTHVPKEQQLQEELEPAPVLQRRDTQFSESMDLDDSLNEEQQQQHEQQQQADQAVEPVTPPPPADGIEVANEDTHTIDLQLDRPLDRFELVDFVRLCLMKVYPYCLYCNHARRIAVNAKALVLHLIGQHRFTATVDSITAEELHAETIVAKLKSYLPALEGDQFMNAVSCCSLEDGRFAEPFNERIFECFQCYFMTASHKELYTHNRRLHIKMKFTCTMCRQNYFSFIELLCHICPGSAADSVLNVQFRCCLCETAPLPSAFRLMVHLRKRHQACDVCLEDCHTQAKLSSHVWKHKLLNVCYRCGIAYRSKQDISKHLFWKHGTESASCKRCEQKRWRHVYHFCVPATQFNCDQCQFTFTKAIYLEVHKRQHTGDFRYACNEEQCEEKFVSRKLLMKHAVKHEVKELPASEDEPMEDQQTPLASNEDYAEDARSRASSERPAGDKQREETKTEAEHSDAASKPKPDAADQVDAKLAPNVVESAEQQEKAMSRKRRKKFKRNKASLEDLNLIAPNLSESDSDNESDSDAGRSSAAQHEPIAPLTLPMCASVDDLDMPRVMLSPSSESDSEEQPGKEKAMENDKELVNPELTEPNIKLEQQHLDKQAKREEENKLAADDEQKLKLDSSSGAESQEVPDIWKNLLQHQPSVSKTETESLSVPVTPASDLVPEPVPGFTESSEKQLRPSKVHVAWSDHDYCKLIKTPPPTPKPSPKKHLTTNKAKRDNASSESDSSSSSSSNSDSDGSSCSCGSNCSCSSTGSSSSDDDSDNESESSPNAAKKALKKSTDAPQDTGYSNSEEYVNVTSLPEEEAPPETPASNGPLFNESDFDTAISDTDEEFYDAHPQKMASDLLAQKRHALFSAHAREPSGNANYDILENSRPSTPSLPEEAAAFADKIERVLKNKKKKRDRKSTCKSASQSKLLPVMPENLASQQLLPPLAMLMPMQMPMHMIAGTPAAVAIAPVAPHQLTELPPTPLTHRPSWPPRMSEGSSCSDVDGQLKRSKRTRRPNKFYGYTSDDENMSSVLAPPLQVGMQLIKPQPPPQLTWAKEDLPTPPKQQRSRSNHHNDTHQSHHQHSSHQHSNGNTRKRNRRPPLGGGSGSAKRPVKRAKQQPPEQEQLQPQLPPIPTLKIRPALLPTSAAASDSSDTSSDDDDDDAEINVTSLLPAALPLPAPAMHPAPRMPVVAPFPPPTPMPMPPAPATRAFNQPIPPALLPNPDFATLQYFKANNIRYPIRPPAGARLAREGESVYCYCRCPYDEVSEMIACDGDNCLIEWFHFECVGIMVAPQGKWYCAECRPKYSEGLYPGVKPSKL